MFNKYKRYYQNPLKVQFSAADADLDLEISCCLFCIQQLELDKQTHSMESELLSADENNC